MNEEDIFQKAAALPESEVQSFLEESCGDDWDLHRRVSARLATEDQAQKSAQTTEVTLRANDQILFSSLLGPGVYEIGRDDELSIQIDEPSLSRKHARLWINLDSVLIEDFESTNGIVVDGHVAEGIILLTPGMDVRLGDLNLEVGRSGWAHSIPESSQHSSEIAPSISSATLVGPRYVPGRKVAEGGMGEIISAQQGAIGRTVAMKVMKREDSDTGQARFVDEARITGQLEHPNIVPVHDLGVDSSDRIFYTMKFVEGVSLGEILRGISKNDRSIREEYPFAELLTIFQKVCDAVAFAHSRGVLHRDLKPDNIMVGHYGEVLVLDWGLAKLKSIPTSEGGEDSFPGSPVEGGELHGETLEGSILGTPRYMSPEQAMGEIDRLSARTDIYSLGCILFELLHLHPTVEAKDALQLIDKVQRGDLDWSKPRYTLHLPGRKVPESLLAVCRKALARKPERRYLSVPALQEDVAAYQAGFPTRAEAAGAFRQMALFVKRHRGIALATVFSIFILGIASSLFLLKIAEEQGIASQAVGLFETEQDRREQVEKRAEQEQERANEAEIREKVALALAEEKKEVAEEQTEAAVQAQKKRDEEIQRRMAVLEYLQNLGAGNPAFEGALQKAEEQAALIFSDIARKQLETGKNKEAINSLGLALEVQPRNTNLRLTRAHALQQQARLPEAIRDYDLVLKQRKDPNVQANRDLSQKLLDQNEAAEKLKPELAKILAEMIEQERRNLVDILNGDNATAGGVASNRPKQQPAKMKGPSPNYSQEEGNLYEALGAYTFQANWNNNRISRNSIGQIRLDLSRMKMSDLSMLSSFPIGELVLSYTSIFDLSALSGLRLHTLRIDHTQVSDLSPLRSLPLRTLEISHRPSGDLTSLAGLQSLRVLYASGSKVTDLSALKGLPLETLHLWDCRATDASALAGMPLQELKLERSHITSLEPLRGMPLRNLNLLECKKLESLEPLSTLTNLEQIALPRSSVGLQFLNRLPRLSKVRHDRFFPDDRYEDAAVFLKLANATDYAIEKWGLRFAEAGLKDWRDDRFTAQDLRGVTLDLRGTEISDLSILEGIPLFRLHLNTKGKPVDLGLLRASQIHHLDLRGANVPSIAPLLTCTSLESLALNYGSEDVFLLEKHPSIRFLDYELDDRLMRPKLTKDQFFAPPTVTFPVEDTLISFGFDSPQESTAGWTGINSKGKKKTVVWTTDPPARNGNGGGAVAYLEAGADGNTGFFSAPEEFLKLGADGYGALIQFRIRQNFMSRIFTHPDLILSAGDRRLVHHYISPPLKAWREISIPLEESAWTWEEEPERELSKEEFLTVLDEMDQFLIRAEFSGHSPEKTMLDGFVIWKPEVSKVIQKRVDEEKRLFEEVIGWRDQFIFDSQKEPNIGNGKERYLDGAAWLEEFDKKSGVCLMHPHSAEKPAVVEHALTEQTAKSRMIEIEARSWHGERGTKVKFLLDGVPFHEEEFHRRWKTLRAPLPSTAKPESILELEFWPLGWAWEHFFIDEIAFR